MYIKKPQSYEEENQTYNNLDMNNKQKMQHSSNKQYMNYTKYKNHKKHAKHAKM